MYLLILQPVINGFVRSAFTFHNVSINSWNKADVLTIVLNLHSIMYLLIRLSCQKTGMCVLNLHSIMYLLIPVAVIISQCEYLYLHSIMYLLIPVYLKGSIPFIFHLHSIMYLLIRQSFVC